MSLKKLVNCLYRVINGKSYYNILSYVKKEL